MRWLVGLLTLICITSVSVATVSAGQWTLVPGSAFSQGESIVSRKDAVELGYPAPENGFKVITSYNGTRYGRHPDGRYGIFFMGGGHRAWWGNEVHFWDRAANRYEIVVAPTPYDSTRIAPGEPDQVGWDYDGDGTPDVAPAMHNRDGGEIVPGYFVVCGSGASPTGASGWATRKRPWVWDFSEHRWVADFANLGFAGSTGCKSWVNPNTPNRVYLLGRQRQFGWIEPSTGASSIGKISFSGKFSSPGGYGAAQWWGDAATGFALACTKRRTCLKISTSPNGGNPVAQRVDIFVMPTGLNGRPPLAMNKAAWAFYPPCECVLATMGMGDIYELRFTRDTNKMVATLVDGLGPYDPEIEPTYGTVVRKDIIQNDLHVTEDLRIIFVSHNPDEGIWYYDPDS